MATGLGEGRASRARGREQARALCVLGLILAAVVAAAGGSRAADLEYQRVPDVIYHKKGGVALTLDVFRPARQTGIGILFMVSGGWVSNHNNINVGFIRKLLEHGQTVFAVVHGSQPKYTIPEIVQDVDRATRFVRHHAATFGVDPQRLGIAGGSAGGHLSLTQGARGSAGNPEAKDPVDRETSQVQAVACFFPPTDFLNYGKTGENAVRGETLRAFHHVFGAKSDSAADAEAAARDCSPITYVTKAMPPTLIVHGDADKLVPLQQSEVFVARLKDVGVEHKLVVMPGKAHGWPTLGDDVSLLADWFDQHLKR